MYIAIANILVSFALLSSHSLCGLASPETVPFVPTLNWHIDGDSHLDRASIRGLLDPNLEKRQYYCAAPKVLCMGRYCCQNSSWNCCIDGSCCYPNYYCGYASNGIIGCCPDGKICTGSVDDHSTIGHPTTRTSTYYYTITSTRTTSYPQYSVTTTTSQVQQPPPPPPVPQPTTTPVVVANPPIPIPSNSPPSVKLPTPTLPPNTTDTGLPIPPSSGQSMNPSNMVGVMGMFVVGMAAYLL